MAQPLLVAFLNISRYSFIIKSRIMRLGKRLDKGQPSGTNKSEGTGSPSNMQPGKNAKDKRLTEKYTNKDQSVASHVKTNNDNRNTDKEDSTNAGGYRN